ncbi:MAG TPA: MFS transporter, partial [Geobacteraceae bacterium]
MESATSRRYALALLLVVNLLNYIDRQVLFAVFPLVKSDLHLSDTALGFLGSAFMFCYMVSAPLFGWIGDRTSRTRLAAGGLLAWSIATAGAGFARTYGALLAARTAVGIGEASFGTVSPGLLADYFPK